jgi:hypothetical protein
MPPRRAQAAARRAAEELVAAAARQPAPSGADAASAGSAAGTPQRMRVLAALAALWNCLDGTSPACAAEALGVEGLFATLLREAAAPPGPHAATAAGCLVAVVRAACSESDPARSGQHANSDGGRAAAAALSAALRSDPARLFGAMGRAAAMQAAGRSGGGAAPAGWPPPPAGAGLLAPAAAAAVAALYTPGPQLFALLRLVVFHLSDGRGPDDGAAVKAFARSGAAVDATLEALVHGCTGFDAGGEARQHAAGALFTACFDSRGVRHLHGAFPRVAAAIVRRLERGAPGWTIAERLQLAKTLIVRWGLTRQTGGEGRLAPAWGLLLDAARVARLCRRPRAPAAHTPALRL